MTWQYLLNMNISFQDMASGGAIKRVPDQLSGKS